MYRVRGRASVPFLSFSSYVYLVARRPVGVSGIFIPFPHCPASWKRSELLLRAARVVAWPTLCVVYSRAKDGGRTCANRRPSVLRCGRRRPASEKGAAAIGHICVGLSLSLDRTARDVADGHPRVSDSRCHERAAEMLGEPDPGRRAVWRKEKAFSLAHCLPAVRPARLVPAFASSAAAVLKRVG